MTFYATHELANGSTDECGGDCVDFGDYEYPCDECVNYQAAPREFPVSADETIREYGRAGRRSAISLWHAPGVRPKRATQGITVGATITTWRGEGVVTRVGTIAGFYMLNGAEARWDASSVRRIHA